MNKFDHFYDQKVTFGAYQVLFLLFASVVNFVFGGFISVLPFAFRLMQQDLFLTFDQTSLLFVLDNLGGIFGAFLFGYALKSLGRKPVLVAGILAFAATPVLVYYSNSYLGSLAFFLSFTLCFSVVYHSLNIFLAETFTKETRATAMLTCNASMSVGKVSGALLLWADVSVYEYGAWKLPYLRLGTLLGVAFTVLLFCVRESVRFSYHRKDYQKAYKDYVKIQEDSVLTVEEFVGIEDCGGAVRRSMAKSVDHAAILWFGLSSAGALWILFITGLAIPNIFGTDGNVLFANVLVATGEVAGLLLVKFLVDHPNYGRKRALIVCGTATLALCGLIFVIPFQWVLFVFFALKVTNRCVFSVLSIHMNEQFQMAVKELSISRIVLLSNLLMMGVGPAFNALIKQGSYAVFSLVLLCALVSLTGITLLPGKKNAD